jgi:endonuclease-3
MALAAAASRLSLQAAIAALSARYPVGEVLTDPLALIVWENVGYLVDGARRQALFEEFRGRIGLDARAIASAPQATLLDIAERGGMNPPERARRLRAIAERIVETCDGDLAAELKALPTPKARALLKSFPAIADPGADKILLFGGYDLRPALDSNGLRVLVRLGFCTERASYTTTYREGVEAVRAQGVMDRDWLIAAWVALREHGKALCKRAEPICMACPVEAGCPKVVVRAL